MKEVTIRMEWESFSILEVPDDWEITSYLECFTDDMLEAIDADAAVSLSPINWEENSSR